MRVARPRKGGRLVAGVDEVGRGPLAGPVVAAAVILLRPLEGLADSKTLCTTERERRAGLLQDRARIGIGAASVAEIDRINILQASLLAMARAVQALAVAPARVIVDGLHVPAVACAAQAIVGGDARRPAISAASILAKVARDAEMCEWHERYPQYGFDRHKGYSTPEHFAALQEHGPCPIHRRSFMPVQGCMQLRLAMPI